MTVGNSAQNFKATDFERAAHDSYVEPRWCVEALADALQLDGGRVWDPCCGSGTIPDVFLDRGHLVRASDLVDRGYGFAETHDFLSPSSGIWADDRTSIITNPPFRIAERVIRHALSFGVERVAILQGLQFLASAGRHALFTEFPPSDILILSKRPSMPPGHLIAEMGDRAFKGGTTDFCWIVWSKPHDRETRVRWLNPIPTTNEGA